jgi:peptidoglycan/LPS O-acetylase OafA/YrhL
MKEPFVTSRMAAWLDLIRAVAALAVLLGHGVQVMGYTGYFPFTIALQQNAVIVFFVLSGLLIAHSAARAPSLRSYAIARVSRILPVSVGAVAISLAVGLVDAGLNAPTLFAADAQAGDPASGFAALLFLGEGYWQTFELNPPHWSLCYEVWFYALFGAAVFLKGRTQALWLAVLCLAAGANVLLLLPCWLFGVALHRWGGELPLRWARPALALAFASLFAVQHLAGPLLGVLMKLAPWDLGYSLYALSDLILAACIAVGLMGMRTLTAHGVVIPSRVQPVIRYFAEMSFSLYLLHWPVLKLLRLAGVSVGGNPVGLGAVLVLVVAVSAGFAALTEHKRPAVRAWLEQRFSRRDLLAAD